MGEDVGRYGGCFAVSKGLLEEFGPERIRDTPLSESAFVGAGIGAALGGMRPIVEIMTVNFSLLALDQIVNNAATLLHMSGGQFNVPLVIRMATGAGRQLAAQHSHSLEGWYAHIPGLKVARAGDGRGRARHALAPRSRDPDPVLIFEHGSALQHGGRARRRRRRRSTSTAPRCGGAGRDVTHHHLRRQRSPRRSTPPTQLAARGHRRRGDRPAHAAPARRRRDLASVEDASRRDRRRGLAQRRHLGGDQRAHHGAAFYELDAPVARVCSAEVPMPYAEGTWRRRRCRRSSASSRPCREWCTRG